MGLLDDLKKQADELKAQDSDRTESIRSNAVMVDETLRRVFVYLNDLGKQLNVVAMPCPFVFTLPTVGDVPGLVFQDFFADYRTQSFLDKYYCREVHVAVRCTAQKALSVKKGPEEMEKFRNFLWQHNIEHKSEQLRDRQRVITHEVFQIPSDFRVLGEIEGDLETGKLRIKTRNVGGFDAAVFQLTVQEFDDRAVEEFAKYFIGRPNEWAGIVKRSVLNPRPTIAAKPKAKREPGYVAPARPAGDGRTGESDDKRGLLDSLKGIFKRDD